MSEDPRTRAEAALRAWADLPGRAAAARLERGTERWEAEVRADAPVPAASLLKIPLAIAAERAGAEGRIAAGWRIAIRDLLAEASLPSLLHALDPEIGLGLADLIGLTVGLSDGPAAAALLRMTGIGAVCDAIAATGCTATDAHVVPPEDPSAPLAGRTTARDALRLLDAAADSARHPLTARALRHSVRNSRIPLGATEADVTIAHKTGSLPGLAHDVARIEADGAVLLVAFLATDEHDTLAVGYAMGIATRTILAAWGLDAQRTRSIA